MATVAVCRFCLGGPDSPTDALLSPCACKGSCTYVHASCLLKWQHATSVPEHARVCQLCKRAYFLPGAARMESYGLSLASPHVRCMRSRPLVCSVFVYAWVLLQGVHNGKLYAAFGPLYALTLLYVCVLSAAWERIQNRALYFRMYWVVYSGHPYHSPLMDVALLSIALVCTGVHPCMGGTIYCMMLPNLVDAHVYTVDRMNQLAL